jgi:hypothetical protein
LGHRGSSSRRILKPGGRGSSRILEPGGRGSGRILEPGGRGSRRILGTREKVAEYWDLEEVVEGE